jgi:hypothetical protein
MQELFQTKNDYLLFNPDGYCIFYSFILFHCLHLKNFTQVADKTMRAPGTNSIIYAGICF